MDVFLHSGVRLSFVTLHKSVIGFSVVYCVYFCLPFDFHAYVSLNRVAEKIRL